MTEEAKLAIEAMKQAFDVFEKMELPIKDRKCTLEYDSVMAIISGFEQVTRERDAVMEDLRMLADCETCIHDDDEACEHCCDFITRGNWRWRGVEVEG